MADIASTLQPVPAPGAGIHPSYVASQLETLTVKGSSLSRNHFVVLDSAGTQLFGIDAEKLSLSQRTHVTETATGTKLCTLRRETWKMKSQYYAEVSEDGPRLFDMKSKFSMGSEKFVITFPNVVADGQEVVLDWKGPAFSSKGEIYLNGMMVAFVEKEHFKLKGEFRVHVAPGMDKLLAVCILACVNNERANNSSGAAAGSGSAAAC